MTDPRQVADAMYANDDATKRMGIEIPDVSEGSATATMVVLAGMTNSHDVCHGGFIFALADTATAYASNGANQMAFTTAADIDFINAAAAGTTLRAVATEQSLRGRAGVYDVEVTDDAGALIAIFRGRTLRTGGPIVAEDDT
jgi:acyl-CoA thioesterase